MLMPSDRSAETVPQPLGRHEFSSGQQNYKVQDFLAHFFTTNERIVLFNLLFSPGVTVEFAGSKERTVGI